MTECMICCESNELLACCDQVCTNCVRQWATIQIRKPGFFKGNANPTCLACKKDLEDQDLEKVSIYPFLKPFTNKTLLPIFYPQIILLCLLLMILNQISIRFWSLLTMKCTSPAFRLILSRN